MGLSLYPQSSTMLDARRGLVHFDTLLRFQELIQPRGKTKSGEASVSRLCCPKAETLAGDGMPAAFT